MRSGKALLFIFIIDGNNDVKPPAGEILDAGTSCWLTPQTTAKEAAAAGVYDCA